MMKALGGLFAVAIVCGLFAHWVLKMSDEASCVVGMHSLVYAAVIFVVLYILFHFSWR